jgi:hypothetical protein
VDRVAWRRFTSAWHVEGTVCRGTPMTARKDKEAVAEPSVWSPWVEKRCRGGAAAVKLRRWRASVQERWRARKSSRVRGKGAVEAGDSQGLL